VKSNERSIRKAAEQYGVKKSTLGDHVSGKITNGSKIGRKTVFPIEVEKQLMGFRFLALMLDSFSGFLKTSSLYRAKKPPNQACPGTPPLNGVFSFMVFARRPALQISCFREIQKPCSATLWAFWLQAVFPLQWEKSSFYQFCY
jgi:hypothetical protein